MQSVPETRAATSPHHRHCHYHHPLTHFSSWRWGDKEWVRLGSHSSLTNPHPLLLLPHFPVSLAHRSHTNTGPVPYHDNSFRVDGLGDNIPVVCDVFHHLIETCSLHLLELQVTEGVRDEVKKNTALPQLLDEELFSFMGRSICQRKQAHVSLQTGTSSPCFTQVALWFAPCGFPLPCHIALELLSLLWTWDKGGREAARPLKQPSHEGISNVVAVSNLISIDLFCVQSTLKKELKQLPSQSSGSHVLQPRNTKGAGQHML